MKHGVQVLKLAFAVGAVTDLLAALMMVFPQFANAFWGLENFTEEYYFAMGMGAPLMLAWTVLLLWAYKKPVERRFISPLTILVIVGIATTNIIMVNRGLFRLAGMFPSGISQGMLLVLFGVGYLHTKPQETNTNRRVVG